MLKFAVVACIIHCICVLVVKPGFNLTVISINLKDESELNMPSDTEDVGEVL